MDRSPFPVLEYGTCSDVRVPAPAKPRRLFDRVCPSRVTPEHTDFEGALAGVHRQATRPGDDVVIVGGGYGITTVVAARQGASVTVFEPTAERRAVLQRTLKINDVDAGDVTLREAVVGDLTPAEADEKGLSTASLSHVLPAELPACDVLELDCEGAELSILAGLEPDTLPRVLAVEVHPIKLDGRADEVVPLLSALGYEVEQYLTHDGIAVSEQGFRDLCAGTTPDVGDPGHQTFPPVVHAVRSDEAVVGSSSEAASTA